MDDPKTNTLRFQYWLVIKVIRYAVNSSHVLSLVINVLDSSSFKKEFWIRKKNRFMTGSFQVPFLPVWYSLSRNGAMTFPHITQSKFPSQDLLIMWINQWDCLCMPKIGFTVSSHTFKCYCCGATEGSEQQHNQDLKEIYKGRRILEFITFYHNVLHLTTLLTTMRCI